MTKYFVQLGEEIGYGTDGVLDSEFDAIERVIRDYHENLEEEIDSGLVSVEEVLNYLCVEQLRDDAYGVWEMKRCDGMDEEIVKRVVDNIRALRTKNANENTVQSVYEQYKSLSKDEQLAFFQKLCKPE